MPKPLIALCISNAIGRLSVVQASSLQSSNWQAGCLPHFPPSCITYAEGYKTFDSDIAPNNRTIIEQNLQGVYRDVAMRCMHVSKTIGSIRI
jgi:hypothetical protein